MKRLRFHSNDQKAIFWVNLGTAVLPSVMALFEMSQISSSRLFFFLLFRFVFSALFLVLTYKMYQYPRNTWYLGFVGVAQILFAVHGQCFLPLYFTALVHLSLLYAFIYSPPSRIFWPITIGGYLIFSMLFVRQWNDFSASLVQVPMGEYFFVIGSSFVVLSLAFIFYSRNRSILEQSALTYGLVGQKTSFVLHDLKNRMLGPVIYVDLLKEHMAQHTDERLHRIINGLATDLEKMKEGIQHLQFSHMLLNEQPQEFSLRESLKRLTDYLQSRHSHIELNVQGDCRLMGARALVDSIFLNLFINSIENFKTRGIQRPQITVQMQWDGIIYRDNGKGFEPDLLSQIRSGHFASESEMGLGLFVIRESARKLGARVVFDNDLEGVRIEFRL
jgi:signal transduction histidine kinase